MVPTKNILNIDNVQPIDIGYLQRFNTVLTFTKLT